MLAAFVVEFGFYIEYSAGFKFPYGEIFLWMFGLTMLYQFAGIFPGVKFNFFAGN